MLRLLSALALSSLVLARDVAGSNVHVQVKIHHRRGAWDRVASAVSTDPSEASDSADDWDSQEETERIGCPKAGDALANATKPALTTACPSRCSSSNLCIYFPKEFDSKCVTTSSRSCYHGDTCAFQCITNGVGQTGWLLTLYNDDAVIDEVNYWNVQPLPNRQAIPVNASLVTQWVGEPTLSDDVLVLYVVGNEAANDFIEDGEQDYADQKILPLGDIVPFEFPPKFFEAMSNIQYLRLENLKFPMPTAKSISSLSFPSLEALFLRNTMLTSFPFTAASLPGLNTLDLSVNTITDITRSGLPDSLTYVNLSSNSISVVNAGTFSENLTNVDLSSNAIKQIGKGSLPTGLEYLYLDNNLLTSIPADVAEMTSLAQIFLSGNQFGKIPDNALPTASLTSLYISNCSLQGVPKAISSMSLLTELNLASNDLSQNPDFSLLPPTLQSLYIDNCMLQKLPAELQNLQDLTYLTLSNNSKAVQDLTSLPPSIQILDLSYNELESIPSGVKDLADLATLTLFGNPLSKLSPSSLPEGLQFLYISGALFQTIQAGTLPQSLVSIEIDDSTMEEAPTDISSMRGLYTLVIKNCRLKAIDTIKGLPGLTDVTLNNNQITSFSGRYPVLSLLDLRNNSLQSLNITSAPVLQTLHLAQNNLTAFPSCVFDMPELLLLNMTGNPIRNFTPTVDQLAFLSRISTVVFDQEMFANSCNVTDLIDVRGYKVCTPGSTNATNFQDLKRSTSKMSAGLVLLNVCLAMALVLLLVTFWRRRKLQKQRLHELDMKTASLEKQQRHQSTASIWADTVLLQNRLDEDLVERKRLLGSGMFGEVWLATYKHENFALKQLKPSHAAVDRELITSFVEEIKLVSSLTHPRVVQFIGVVWTKESDIAMVTEFMEGGDLRTYLDENPKLDDGWTVQMAQIALDITEAIVYLHSLDPVVIHRDLKSRNVLLDKRMRAKLSDFGISRYKLDDETMTAAVGTIRWVAPEVLAGKQYNELVDIYSLGIILSEIDTHKLPFFDVKDESGSERLTDSAIAGLLMSGSLSSSFSESCPSEIRSLAERCTAFDPENRPSGLQVAYELRTMLRSTSWVSSRGTFHSSSAIEDDGESVQEHSSESTRGSHVSV